MTNAISTAVKLVVRTAILWIVDGVSLWLAAWLLPGMEFYAVGTTSRFAVIMAAAMLLAVINMLIRPIILLIARPLGWIAMFVVGYLVNALALWLAAWLLPGFEVGFWAGLIGGIVIAFFNTIITGILDVQEEGSFYQNRIETRASQEPYAAAAEPGKGLMMVEIDGLSYWHITEGSRRRPACPRSSR